MSTQHLHRRSFLKVTAGGLALGGTSLALGGDQSTADPTQTHWDVIVIGGGFAGVTAARDLSLRGRRTLLVEARPRLGGRTFTAAFGGHRIDLGGTWIGSAQPFVWSEINRYGLPLEESAAAQAEQVVWWEDEARRVTGLDEYAAIYEPAANAFYAPAREALPRPFEALAAPDRAGLDQKTAREAIERLQLSPTARDLILSFAAINGHAYANRSSYLDQLRWFALAGYDVWRLWDNLSRFRIAGGTAALLEQMAADSRAELMLSTPVRAVTQSANGVDVVTGRGQTLRTASLLVAVPLNCLDDIDFQPGLSSVKQEASRRRHTGSGTKVYAKIRGEQPVFFGHGRETDPLCFAWTEYADPDARILCGFGASPELLDVNDTDAVRAAFSRFQPSIELDSSVSYDWNLDPYAKGTWCMFPPGLLTEGLEELQRPEGRVFFAGSDIASGWRGFIDGAIESGARVASHIHHHLS